MKRDGSVRGGLGELFNKGGEEGDGFVVEAGDIESLWRVDTDEVVDADAKETGQADEHFNGRRFAGGLVCAYHGFGYADPVGDLELRHSAFFPQGTELFGAVKHRYHPFLL